jgi:hypothetical protein
MNAVEQLATAHLRCRVYGLVRHAQDWEVDLLRFATEEPRGWVCEVSKYAQDWGEERLRTATVELLLMPRFSRAWELAQGLGEAAASGGRWCGWVLCPAGSAETLERTDPARWGQCVRVCCPS